MALNAPIFSWMPSYEPERSRDARLLEMPFADSYGERDADGLNHMPSTWSLQWVNEEQAVVDAIYNFLSERGGYKPFYWIEPTGRFSGLYTCRSPRIRQTGPIYHTVTATFEESFALPNELQTQLDLFGDISTLHAALQAIENAVNS